MRSEPLHFTSAGGHKIAARLDRPVGTPHAFALFAHCFTCDKNSLAAVRIARALTAEGIAVLRFDFTGLGESEGSFGQSDFGTNVEDLVAAADFMRAELIAPSLLIGHSLGGAAVLAAAGLISEVKAVAVIGAPFSVAHVAHLFAAHLDDIARDGQAEVQIGGRPFTVSQQLVDGIKNQDQGGRIAGLHRALLVMHSPVDQIVGVENAAEIFTAAKHPKSFVSLDDADHLLTRARDADYVAQVVAGWSSRYVGTAAEAMPADDGAVRAVETGAGKFQVEITAGSTRFYADEPVDVGGLDSGPTPYQLVSAGLAACTAMTLRLYSARKQLPLERASVAVRHAKQPGTTPADLFTREVTLEGPLDDAQRAKLLEIADKCPVHRSLEGGASVETALVAAPSLMVAATPDDEHYRDMDAACREEG
ncbi:bifunctional alpha/beta hydrolase/OsmC family protein [Sphingopyxis sp. EG6]|jgi:putative redox protein|uniref:bifunctional alpha/beta hydrolase/OsmC family protein n=1 Tax=Sphingopyxis sp. EG6 TaxID=1874061 RepID=UPI000DC613F1|nr:bifunctional alpha/beta hydrolase/OsmC family protein [Sphingopyxis sp. EG6]BBB08517.1 OsmC family protein [Sphingopyxis sp. EG6]